MTHLGVRRGCQAGSLCCLNAVSLWVSYARYERFIVSFPGIIGRRGTKAWPKHQCFHELLDTRPGLDQNRSSNSLSTQNNIPSGLRLLRGPVSPFESSAAAIVLYNDGGWTVCDESNCGEAWAKALGLQQGNTVASNVPVPVDVWVCRDCMGEA
jgi:hypothetical protein